MVIIMTTSVLYPVSNSYRDNKSLNGLWQFKFDPQKVGPAEHWERGLTDTISMPVPGSFADLFTDRESRDYTGDFWYQTDFYVPRDWDEQTLLVRFGSLTHRAVIYCNGVEITTHEGGFLPVVADITAAVNAVTVNHLVIKLNNELSEATLPVGTTKTLPTGRLVAQPYFDFFNYAGIQRNVWLMTLPKQAITDFDTVTTLQATTATLQYHVQSATGTITAQLCDADGQVVAENTGVAGKLVVSNPHLWQVRHAYLYTLKLQLQVAGQLVDAYQTSIGLRTVAVHGEQILINDEPVYLKGYAKHEDFDVLGKAFNWSIVKRDFECMKWTNANCFRTSHYPYAEEWYQMADAEGFLVIDEVPAVGMMQSTQNFADAGKGKFTHFFETPTVPTLKHNHITQVNEMIQRDKNHPCVFAWSLFNEPETTSTEAATYFKDIFKAARAADVQQRPCTGAFEKNSQPDTCQVYPLCDFICLNRYYGWYINSGESFDEATVAFKAELDQWQAKHLHKPFVFSEFGTDNLVTEHKLPSVMWSQEYQNEFLQLYFDIFDEYSFIQGELIWNFADFQTNQGVLRVNGNRKGIFTRERQPKDAAFLVKKRWE
ncbi:beta-glucuronidase [Lactiplantibacillus fabifermentans DSM 21115]|uniref:Beta-glucuronidase n=2 Tax=Lactiplantibacillus fabifermentans TaxID=483011 RepID=A0A0R2NM69_9LACO|nr:beta-glucuronidase [Lactiplantibacillus fabifermentans DSM 21115]